MLEGVVAVDPPLTRKAPPSRLLLALWALLLLAAIGAGVALFALRDRSGAPVDAGAVAPAGPTVSWAAGRLAAPDFRLRDAAGATVSLAQYRGRRVILTFVDPHCTTFCPRASLVVDDALRRLPAAERPAVIAVSVDPAVRSPATLRKEARRFHWLPQWRWGVGTHAQLAAVWRAYQIAVLPTKGEITHTEAAYLIDARGDQRALFLWPFRAADLGRALAQLR